MESVQEILLRSGRFRGLKSFDEPFDIRAYELRKAEKYNASVGNEPDYNCAKCQNRGSFMRIDEANNELYDVCECMKIRQSIRRMRASGLENIIKRCTFESFRDDEPWQTGIKHKAQDYSESGYGSGAWFFIGGQPGCGKTHLCTAICRKALYAGRGVYYMPWMTKIVDLKTTMYDDPDKYAAEISQIKRIELLYIDDFFKPVRDIQPSGADVKLAYDIINYRYINNLPTIISSEKSADELVEIDDATGSRICEKARGYIVTVERGEGKNWRLREAETQHNGEGE